MNARFYPFRLVCLSLLTLSACQAQPVSQTGIMPSPQPSPQPSSQPTSSTTTQATATPAGDLSTFVMRLQDRFRVQAVDESHQLILKAVITQFQSDLVNGKTDDYYQSPSFSIKLLAGSEGSYFHTGETLARVTSLLEGYALALVIYPDQSFDVYKGQLSNGAFYFNGASTLPENKTTYLIGLNPDLETQVLTGSLTPFQLQSVETSATPTPTATPSAAPTPLPSPSVLNFDLKPPAVQDVFERERRQREAYLASLKQQRPAPPPPPENRPGRFPPPNQAAPPPQKRPPQSAGQAEPQGNAQRSEAEPPPRPRPAP